MAEPEKTAIPTVKLGYPEGSVEHFVSFVNMTGSECCFVSGVTEIVLHVNPEANFVSR